jgi:hypothetical protein
MIGSGIVQASLIAASLVELGFHWLLLWWALR